MTKKLIALFIALVMLATPFTFFVNADGRNPFAIGVGDTPGGGNDYFASAQVIHSDFTVTGTLATDTEIDYYKLTIPIDGLVNFWLGNIPAGCDYDLMVFDEDEEVKWTSLTDNDYEEILGQEVSAGEIYYILVCAYSGYSTTQPYTLRAKVYPESYTYYGQTAPSTTTDYVTNFSNIYDARYTSPTEDWHSLNWYQNLSQWGCFVCSFAMVLSNLNKTTVRQIPNVMAANGSSIPNEYMPAQPYTIMWANTTPENTAYSLNTIGTTFTYQNGKYITASNASDMCFRDRSAIGLLFGVTVKCYDINSFSTEEKKNAIANFLSRNPEGIILVFDNTVKKQHAMVITETTYSGTYVESYEYLDPTVFPSPSRSSASNIKNLEDYDRDSFKAQIFNSTTRTSEDTVAFSDGDMFTAYDPGRYNDSIYCNGVSLNRTYTSNYYDWYDLTQIIIIEQ